jgi:hypothetical protein
MADGPEPPAEGIAHSRPFPWVRLFRAFHVASDARTLILAAAGLLLMHFGWGLLDRAFGAPRAVPAPWTAPPPGIALEDAWDGAAAVPWRMTEPVRALVGPFVAVFAPERSTRGFAHALLSALWGAIVWGLAGGAIARIALLDVSCARSLSLTGAVRFALRHAGPLIAAPLCPLLAVGAFGLFCALFGLLYQVPAVGAAAAGVLAFVPLLAGLAMTVVVVCLALGWPLMAPAVAAEGEDSFDALSRSFAYVNQRRGHYLAYVLLAWAVGCAGLVFVDVFAALVVRLAAWGMSFSAPRDVLLPLWGGANAGRGAAAHRFWIGLVGLVAHGWIYAYFWSSSAVIYLVLRHDVDGTPLHELHGSNAPAAAVDSVVPAQEVDEQPATPAKV